MKQELGLVVPAKFTARTKIKTNRIEKRNVMQVSNTILQTKECQRRLINYVTREGL